MRNKRYFDGIAPKWDELRQGFFSEAVKERALAKAQLQEGKTAADIGAGTGFITEGLVEGGLYVLAIDQSLTMLQVMKRKFSGTASVQYCRGDVQHLPVRTEAVDYVFANMCLHHVEHPAAAIQEMVRILKFGGMLVITDLDEHSFKFLTQERTDRWMGFKREDVHMWFAESGLNSITVDDVGEQCLVQSNYTNNYADISIFIASGVK
jgi:ubiquinone/menaquinone biosynthesis C-methylase UbiE